MKRLLILVWGMWWPAGLVMAASKPALGPDLPPEVRRFIDSNERHARALIRQQNVELPEEVQTYFRAARGTNWAEVKDAFDAVGTIKGPASPGFSVWPVVLETHVVLEAFAEGEPAYARAFGAAVVKSLPPGSVYFGRNTGHGLPAAFTPPPLDKEALVVLSQNSLADASYLTYLAATWKGKVQTPAKEDSERAFNDYLEEARKRLEHDRKFPHEPSQIRPGEDVREAGGRLQVSGQVSVMSINGLLAKWIFEQNPDREFFVEESFPLDWMYPHLSPHELVMKIHRQPQATVTPAMAAADRTFWLKQQRELIGDWLTPETSVAQVCDWVDRVWVKKDLAGFGGDPAFVRSEFATTLYSKLRGSIGGLYSWHISKSRGPEEQQRMIREAEFAFKQAYALRPTSPEALFRAVNLLVQRGQFDDALRLARTSQKLTTADGQIGTLIRELERMQKANAK